MRSSHKLSGRNIFPPQAVGTTSGSSEPEALRPVGFGRAFVAACVLALIGGVAWWLHGVPGRGVAAAFSLLIGGAFGVLMQRGRFCFYCIFRDFIEHKNSRPFYSVLAALAVGSICYTVFMHMFLPNPLSGRLPPDAHIGPVSWVLIIAGVVFGIGMALSGACVSGHLYRLGEGYTRAPFALIGTAVGFGLGFLSWRPLYASAIAKAPLLWLPRHAGYFGALAIQLSVLGAIGLLLLRFLPARDTSAGESVGLTDVWRTVFVQRWGPGATGSAVGVLGAIAYVRVSPLGVTSQIGSLARTTLSDAGLLSGRLNGLDTFAGCVTLVIHTISDNGLLILGVVGASFAMALLAGRFKLSKLTLGNGSTALLGGVLMGWGSMIALGCTVGTLLSGIMASALSGWVFFAAVFAGVWASIKLGIHRLS